MITLITGTPGSGKTLYAVSLLEKYTIENKFLLEQGKEPRNLYSDIDGLNMEGVEIPPDDWRDTPDGSVIFYDEIQQREAYKKQKNANEIVSGLQVHRHTGHDIYAITQFPVLLHSDFKAVVGLHNHLHRGWGLLAATVYQWAYCVDAPNAKSNKNGCEHSFKFNFPKRLFTYYKSATQHTHKKRIPKKLFFIIGFIVIMTFFVIRQFSGGDNIISKIFNGDPEAEQVQEVVEQSNIEKSPDKIVEEVIKEQGIYNPLHGNYIQDVNKVPVSGMAFGTRCSVYNYKGQLLHSVSHADCMAYLSEYGTLPKIEVKNDLRALQATTTTRRYDKAEAESVQSPMGSSTIDNPF